MLAVHTGLRQGELLRLRWVDLSPTLDLATVPVTKNTDPKHVPLNADARAALAMLPRYGPTVIAWPWGDPLSDTTLYCAFVRVCRAAGITDFRWHDLRHTCASHLAMEGIDLHTVGTVLGHRDPKSTRRYAHLSRAHTAAAMDRLSERLAQPETPSAAHAVAVTGSARTPATGPDLERNWNATSGRQTPAKRKYVEGRRVEEWTRSQPIRTAGLLPVEFPILMREQSLTYQDIAPEAVRLRRLGMTDTLAASILGVTDKTIAKAVRWWSTRFGA
jgi:hypothetical protein